MAGIAVLVIGGVIGWLSWPAPRWTVESSRPFISTLALEGEPAFSPDGKMLAYTSGNDLLSRKIYVRNVAGGDAIKITNDDYDDISPSWSSDGTRIAYIAVKAGEPCRIMVTSVPGGRGAAGRTLRLCADPPRFPGRPALRFSIMATRRRRRIAPIDPKQTNVALQLRTDIVVRLDLDSGEKTILPKKSDNTILAFRHLQCSPDGKSLLFIGRESASTDVLRIRDLASGRGTDAGQDRQRRLGRLVGGFPRRADRHGQRHRQRNHRLSDRWRRALSRLCGGHQCQPSGGGRGRLAGAGNRSQPAKSGARQRPTPAAQPDIIDPANGRSWAPTFAPDGTLAFLSNRSGTNAIWIMKPGGAPALLYDGGLSPLFRLEFSPDGKYLAMPIAAEDGVTINILTADGANVSSFHSPTLGGGAPTWTPDSKEVIAFDKSVRTYIRVDIADPAQRRLAAPPLWGAIIYHGGNDLRQRFDKPGYWQIDSEPRLVTGKYPAALGSAAGAFGR